MNTGRTKTKARIGRPQADRTRFGATGRDQYRCFAASTLIDTPCGPRPVEALQPGDMVSTLDHGAQPVRWVWQGWQPLQDVAQDLRPVLIRAGSLGSGHPTRDLILSPGHRVLVGEGGQIAGPSRHGALGAEQLLTSARGIRRMLGRNAVHWFNFACDRHEVICANGALVETLLIDTAELPAMPVP